MCYHFPILVTRTLKISFSICLYWLWTWDASGQSQYESATDFAKYAIKLRESGLLTNQPKQQLPPVPRPRSDAGSHSGNGSALSRVGALDGGRYSWRLSIMTTVFWIGEHPSPKNPVPNDRSSWDPNWSSNYGGYDNPDLKLRRNFIPLSFLPRQNPFYVALPYNDVEAGHTKPEAKTMIPWFKDAFVREGQTVLKGRWIAIRRGNRICYAQWEDCGPFYTDHWQYVFGNERPRQNANQSAGLDVSPAVRDYLDLGGIGACDWKFVDFQEVPPGPWAMYGENNRFVILRRQSNERFNQQKLLFSATN
jgi:hypothetical protein